jgi:predicted Zn finger-like uncharacterized protein
LRLPMRIVCPTCDATYEVPDALIGAGRRLRCAKCAHEWLVEPPSPAGPGPEPGPGPAPPPAAPVPMASVPPPMVEPRRPAPPPAAAAPAGGRFAAAALWAAWIGTVLLLAGAVAGAWIWRDPIMAAWPPAARVYLLFGAA